MIGITDIPSPPRNRLAASNIISIGSRIPGNRHTPLPPPLPIQYGLTRWQQITWLVIMGLATGVTIFGACRALRPYTFLHYCTEPLRVTRVNHTTVQVQCVRTP